MQKQVRHTNKQTSKQALYTTVSYVLNYLTVSYLILDGRLVFENGLGAQNRSRNPSL